MSDGEPWITFAARDFLDQTLSETSRVFEWGSGGSTLFLLARAREVHTIEHDEVWFRNVEQAVQRAGFTNWHGRLLRPEPIGASPSQQVLDPADWQNCRSGCTTLQNYSMANYVHSIDQFEDGYFDVIMVDGRARPSCLYRAWNKLKGGGFLILDNAEVSYYAPVSRQLSSQSSQYLPFAGAGPYVGSFWLTCAWQRPFSISSPRVANDSNSVKGVAA